MSTAVAILPTSVVVDRAWARYLAYVAAITADERLRADLPHNQAMARAWGEWRDLYLAWCARCR